MNRAEYTTLKDGLRYNSLDRKAIDQKLIDYFKLPNEIPIMTKIEAYNGIIQMINMGLTDLEDFDRAITIEDFNPNDPKIKQQYMEIDKVKTTARQIDSQKLTQAFSNDGMRKGFMTKIVNNMYNSLDYKMWKEHMTVLFKQKIGDTPFNIDKTITIGGPFKKQDGTYDEDKIVNFLVDVNKLLNSFGTPGTEHTKFTQDNKQDKYITAFNRNDFRIFWNSKFKEELKPTKARLFNPDELNFDVGTVMTPMDFDLIANSSEFNFTNAEKTAIKKTVAFIYHKNALNVIVPETDMVQDEIVGPIKFKYIYRLRAIYGHGRNLLFPIVKINTV